MPAPVAAKPDNWPFFIPNQQQPSVAPVVLVPQQTVPASVNSYEVNNLIMSSQQKPLSLMTSVELHRKVDQQIQQHWFLLDERPPSTIPLSQQSTPLTLMPPPHPQSHSHSHHHHPHQHQHADCHHHHHHQSCSHSAGSSPNLSETRKKTVCFDDTSAVRRYSVDDLNISQQTGPLKSCLKSSSTTSLKDETHQSTEIFHHCQTQTTPTSQKPRPSSAQVTRDVYRPSSVPAPIEHWHSRQLKSAPSNN